MPTVEEFAKRFGYISGYKHTDRVQIRGFKLVGSGPSVTVMEDPEHNLNLVICLDPLSPFGECLGRYCIPFIPSHEFHLEKATLSIYPIGEDQIRMEVRFLEQRKFADHDDQILEMVYGVQVKAQDTSYLRRI